MSSSRRLPQFDLEDENWWSRGTFMLAKRVEHVGSFVRSLRVQMRFSDLSRAPLRMLRLQLKESVAECDWLARAPDPWDETLLPEVGQRHASLQALKDAVVIRGLLFYTLPDVDAAYLRIYRESPVKARELIMTGHVHRGSTSFRNVRSVAMRAKLLGFRFSLEDDVLRATREMSNTELVDW